MFVSRYLKLKVIGDYFYYCAYMCSYFEMVRFPPMVPTDEGIFFAV